MLPEMYTITQWVFYFYFYSLLGWIWESCYVSAKQHHWVNRGFLNGPFLPIYGSGAVCVLIVTMPFRRYPVLVCLTGMVAATLMEYVTGAVMERLFRVRYWDYSGKLMNVNGYICLSSTLCWGVMSVLMVYVLHAHVESVIGRLDDRITGLAVLIITPILSADFATSFHAALRLRDALMENDRIREELEKIAARKAALEAELEKIAARADTLEGELRSAREKKRAQASAELQELLLRMGEYRAKRHAAYVKSARNLLRRNPGAVSYHHRESFAELKQHFAEKQHTSQR